MNFITILYCLFVGHAIADGALQHKEMSIGKQRHVLQKDNTFKYNSNWWYWIISHSLVHSGFVYLCTYNLLFAIGELIIHAITDFCRTEGIIGRKTDQIIHCSCKILWAVLTIYSGGFNGEVVS